MDEPIFDLILVEIYDERWILAGEGGERIELPAPPLPNEWANNLVGRRGYAERSEQGWWRFMDYRDQSLSRMPQLDGERGLELGWKCEARPEGFRAPFHIVPGECGGFVADETQSVTIQVPPEFHELCERFGVDVERVLQGFVADAAGLMNWVACPRADGLSSNGSDERMMAQDYIERAYCRAW